MSEIVVLAAKPFYSNYKTIGDLESPLLMPLNGHTLLDEIVALYPSSRLNFVINESAFRAKRLIESRQKGKSNIEFIQVPLYFTQLGPASTLIKIISEKKHGIRNGFFVLFGDSLIKIDENIVSTEPVIYGIEGLSSSRYSYFTLNDQMKVKETYGKGNANDISGIVYSEIGAYFFPSVSEIDNLHPKLEFSQMSDLLKEFHCISFREPEEWIDLGHWDNVISSFFLGKARSFNNIQISPDRQYLTKTSSNIGKIRDEYNYLQDIPDTLKFYFPRVQMSPIVGSYKIEFWPLKSLAEYFVFWNMSFSAWEVVSTRILDCLNNFKSFYFEEKKIPSHTLFEFYYQKLVDRILLLEGPALDLLSRDYITLNNKKLLGFPLIKESLIERLQLLSEDITYSFTHGDLCFSNILIDPSTMTIKLIDPRGSFCGEIHQGDLRYDAAKLRHSFHGLYDFIANDIFSLKVENLDEFDLEMFVPENYPQVNKLFDDTLEEFFGKETYSQVKILEGTLFLSMLPLHSESSTRQVALALRAISILNEELNHENLF